jgi:hypothetical protein
MPLQRTGMHLSTEMHHYIVLAAKVSLDYMRQMSKLQPSTPRVPETNTRKTVSLPDSLWQEIAEFRFSKRFGTEAEAVRRLLIVGLETENSKAKK